MASRWREWDIDFKDDIIPNGHSVIVKQSYQEPRRLDQSGLAPVSVPGDLLELIERECESRRQQDCILVSSRDGESYLYTRDGEMQADQQELRREEQPNSPKDSRERNGGVGRAQLLRQRADKASALAGNQQNELPKKSIGRGRGKSKTNSE